MVKELIVPYTDFGPNRIEYRLYAVGAGGLSDQAILKLILISIELQML